MNSFVRSVCVCAVLATCVLSVCGWHVPESAGSNIHFYDRDKLQQQNKRFDLPEYFDQNAQPWGQFPAQSQGGGGVGGSQYFGDNIVMGHFDANGVGPTPWKVQQGSDGTLDSMQYCKCISGPECEPIAKQPAKSHYACGAGQILCCYEGHPRYQKMSNSDRFHREDSPYNIFQNPATAPSTKETQDQYSPNSVSRLPNIQRSALWGGIDRPSNYNSIPISGMFINQRSEPVRSSGGSKAAKLVNNRPVLVRPGGVAGLTGPNTQNNNVYDSNSIPNDKEILVGPGGPTGIVGPAKDKVAQTPSGQQTDYTDNQPPLIVGPGLTQDSRRKLVLSGPEGPKDIVGALSTQYELTPTYVDDVPGRTSNQGVPHVGRGTYAAGERNTAASAKRGVLVGPGGPTGIVGPSKYEGDRSSGQKGLLVGPGGPWGAIGPVDLVDTAASAQRGVLVGPGGPTGIIGPASFNNRPGVLVGPGGPTGIIGPVRRPYGSRLLAAGYGPYGYRAQKTVFGPDWLSETPQRAVLVGPGGLTGQIGPPRRK